MFCPRCGSNQSEELKFCKACGANLFAVRQVVDSRETDEKFDWGKTWVAEMFMSSDQAEKRQLEMERRLGITPDVKRYNEIKAGVITASVGIAVAIFLYFLMQGIILGGNTRPEDAAILSRVWIAGVIPFFVGLALIVNGVFVSKKQAQIARQQRASELLDKESDPQALRPADSSGFIPSDFSVTEHTTKHLKNSRHTE
jgi:hypothetical protein